MRKIMWVAVGALVMAAIFAMPVLGGPSIGQQLQSLVSREKKLDKRVDALAKRKAGRRGPAGPAGPAGAAGAKGDTGAKGATGAPASLDALTGFTASGSIGTSTSTLTTATLASAGAYLLDANATLVNTSGGAITVTCDLVFAPTAELIDTASVRLAASGGLDTETLALTGALEPAGGGTVRLDCDATASGVTFSDADLVILG